MVYKVFISHSTKDMDIVHELCISLEFVEIEPYVSEYDPEPGEELSQKIKNNIDDSEYVVALLTDDGIRSQWVNHEIGYADKAGKKIIPIVEEGVKVSGFLKSKEYIRFNRSAPSEAFDIIMSRLQNLKIGKKKKKYVVLAGIAVFFFGLIFIWRRRLSKSENKEKEQIQSGQDEKSIEVDD
ncbi:toll/interleukin-1 receptor domain-containing protein [Halobacteriota archaeon]